MSGYIYLASPYTHSDPAVRQERFEQVCRAAARLMLAGRVVFSPIAHGHPVEQIGICEAKDGEFWMRQCVPLLRHASELVVLMLDGWEKSAGVGIETEIAEALGLPIRFIAPDALEVGT